MSEVDQKTKIDRSYYIDSDSYQYLLQRKSVARSGKNKGEEVYTTVSYHSTVKDVLNKYKEIRTREGRKECKDIKELRQLIIDLDNKIDVLFDL